MRTINAPLSFSAIELRDLAKAWVATSLAFTIFFLVNQMVPAEGFTGFAFVFVISVLTAGVGFIVHELCHKIVAHKFRVHGEFRSNDGMLLFSILFALMGVIIAAPGAVYLSGQVSRRESGIIAAAGPASNLVLCALFFPMMFFPGVIGSVGSVGLLINAILGAFNMIPFLTFDGHKVWAWSKPVYWAVLLIAIGFVALAYLF